MILLVLLICAPFAAALAQTTTAELPAPQAPLTSSDLSIWGLFWSAHIVVKSVMVGLLVASIWVWAIVIDKTLLYMRTKRAMDRFEQTFWSGQSLEELYRTPVGAADAFDGRAVRRRDARVEALVRGHQPRRSAAFRCASTR